LCIYGFIEYIPMTSKDSIKHETINVSIQFGDIKVQFNGEPENVTISVMNFLSKNIPEIDLARRISLNYSIPELINIYSPIIKITPEGPKILPDNVEIQNKKFSDKEIVMLYLLGSKIAFELGKISDKSSRISDIQSSTNLNPKSISSRLSELVKAGYVSRSVNKENQLELVVYGITTVGISWLNNIITKKVSTK
jgi:DNA-binding HxlR family transcriptional regulator